MTEEHTMDIATTVRAPALLRVSDLCVSYDTLEGPKSVVRDLSLSVGRGETVGLMGESGSGKSVTARAIAGLLRRPGRITGGEVLYQGNDLLALSSAALRRDYSGNEIGFVFQDALAALDPCFTIGHQLEEMWRLKGVDRRERRRLAVEALERVSIRKPDEGLQQYPHQFSGGMRQRVMLAIALSRRPSLLIADEPTTALDATVQADVLRLVASLVERMQLATLLISHDVGVIAQMCEYVYVMKDGEVVEHGPVSQLLTDPSHEYTKSLIAATPTLLTSR